MIDTVKGLFRIAALPPKMSLLFKTFNILLCNLKEAFSVDDLVQNPNCLLTNIIINESFYSCGA
jgi:hypothetical protein